MYNAVYVLSGVLVYTYEAGVSVDSIVNEVSHKSCIIRPSARNFAEHGRIVIILFHDSGKAQE
jgi:hypothetical protein